MYLIYAPPQKFGKIPPGQSVVSDDAPFYSNVAFCHNYYWKKIHCNIGCRDITPRFMRKLRAKRDLKTIAVLTTGGIGDILWTMPIIRGLKEKYPTASIMVITEKKRTALWRHFPYIVGVAENTFWNTTGIMRKTDEFFDFGGVATAYKKQMKLDPIEAMFKEAELPLPKEKAKCRPQLIVTLDEGKRLQERLQEDDINIKKDKIIVLSIESSTSNRNWPFEYTKELTKLYSRDGYKIIWLGSTPEYSERLTPGVAKELGALNLVKNTGIREAITLISLSDLFIGPNSGLMVIATAQNIPTIGLFGAFDPKLRTKFYEKFASLWGRPDCAPCNEHWTECRKGHPAPCMKMISPFSVYEKGKELLKKYPRHILGKIPIE